MNKPGGFAGGFAAVALLAASGGLGGCVSLLPKAKPVQLYQFGGDDPASTSAPATRGGPIFAVALSQTILPQAAQGDGMLTLAGDRAAYIDGARWASPAVLMFQEDAVRAFEDRARRTRLLDRSAVGAADALLRLDVSRFAAVYDPASPGVPPTARVTVRATLSRPDGGRAIQQVFDQAVPAGQNRVTAIVAAYGHATRGALNDVVAWTDQVAPALAQAAQPAGTGRP